MAYVITEGCVDITDRTCLTQCPVDCIYRGDRMLYINPDDCIDCGACASVCPQNAIFFEDELPERLSLFADVNREFFAGDDCGPAESGEVDDIGVDHPHVRAIGESG